MTPGAGEQLPDGIVFDGRRFKVRLETLARPVGGVERFEIVETRAAAAVVPILAHDVGDEPSVVLVAQERPAIGGRTLEIPAGLLNAIDGGSHSDGTLESPDQTAARELTEETGFGTPTSALRRLTTIYTTPGICDEAIHVYLAQGLRADDGARGPVDTTEIERVVALPLREAVAKIGSGEIRDAKTIVGLLLARDALAALAGPADAGTPGGGAMPAPTDPTAIPFQSSGGTVEPATPDAAGEQGLGALSLENILTQEFGYANVTAYQAMEDRARVFGLYLTLVGVLAAALGAVSQLGGSFEKQYLLPLGAALLLLAGVLGSVFFRQLVKTRLAWRSSAEAMGRIKEYYISRLKVHVPDVESAFLWRLRTLPKGEQKGTITHLICYTTAVIASLCTGTALLILGVYLTVQGWLDALLRALGGSPSQATSHILSYGASALIAVIAYFVSVRRYTAYYDATLNPRKEAEEIEQQERAVLK